MGKPNLQDLMDDYMVRIFNAAFKHIMEKIEEPPTPVNMCSPETCETGMPITKYAAKEWMPKGWWLAQDNSGVWYIYSQKPRYEGYAWSCCNDTTEYHKVPDWLQWDAPVFENPYHSIMLIV